MAARGKRDWRGAAGRLLVVLALAAPALAAPVEGPLESVVFEAGDTIRGVAERYLKDADLWPQILELSGIASPAELRPGVALQIPVMQVAAADEALAFSLAAIQKATAEGARIFAPVEIGQAIENRDTAVEQRDLGAWAEVVSYAGLATEFADKALAISVAQRDRAAEAVVSDAQGSVEGRAPDQPRWSPRAAEDVLVEFERLRTLSASTAQVTFRDLSRLRLNPNSNAIIQRMRSDPLTGGEVTKVSLVNGDFYALLNQLGDRTAFEVAVPGVETATQSADFWVKHDAEGSRFTNYDAPALEITRGAETISIGENEGAVLPNAGATELTHVLARTELAAPFDGAELFDPAVTLAWQPAEGAEGYWLEVAADADFNVMQASEWGVRDTSRRFDGLGAGEHYWRVSSLDRLGLPGVRSLSWRFRIVDDATPPFVALAAPKEAEVVTTAEVAVSGEAEPGAEVTVNDAYVPVADNGGFATTLTPVEGDNSIERRRRRPGRQPHRADPRLHLAPGRRRQHRPRPCGAARRRGPAAQRLERARRRRRLQRPTPGRRSGWWRRTARWRCRRWSDAGGGFHFTVPATEAGADYRVEILGADEKVAGAARARRAPGRAAAGDRARPAAEGHRQRLARRRRRGRGRGDRHRQRRGRAARRRALRGDREPRAGNERHRDRRHRRGRQRRDQAGGDDVRHRPARDRLRGGDPPRRRGGTDRDPGRGARRLRAPPGRPLRPERGRRPSARLPALRRRDRALPRDAAGGAGGAGARRSHGRGLRGQRGEAERVEGEGKACDVSPGSGFSSRSPRQPRRRSSRGPRRSSSSTAPRPPPARATPTTSSASSSASPPTSPTASTSASSTPSPSASTTPATAAPPPPPPPLFRLSGGEGAYTAAPAAGPGRRRRLRPPPTPPTPRFAGGRVLAERTFDVASPTDDAWVTLAPLAAADGELIDGRAWFRLDVIGAAGDTGNAFTVEASLSPDRSDPAPDARLIAYQPTIRWREGGDPTEVRFDAPEGTPLTLQSFDGAEGEIYLVSTFAEERLPASGQDEWRLAPFAAPGGTAAITLRGGTETPNDVTLAVFGPDGRPVALEMPPRPVPPRRAPGGRRRRPPARQLHLGRLRRLRLHRRRPALLPLALRRRRRERRRRSSPTPSPGPAATRPSSTSSAPAPRSPAAPASPCRCTSARRRSPTPASRSPPPPASRSPSTAARSTPSDSPLTRYHWTFADGAEADGAAATHAYERPGLYRAVLRVEDASGHPCDFGSATREVTVNFPPVAEAGEAQYAATGQTVTLGGGASYDVDGKVVTHRWDMGDGTRLDGATVTHAYAEPGVYTATLTVTDDSGVANATATDTVTLTVNAPPVPAATGPDRPIAVGEIAAIDGSGSTDADGAILSWSWDFGDGAKGEGPQVQYAWAAPGVYPVTLTVTDDSATPSADHDHHDRRHRQRRARRRRRPRPVGRRQRGRLRRRRLVRRRRPHHLLGLGLRRRRHRLGAHRPPRLRPPRQLRGGARGPRRQRRAAQHRTATP